MADELAAIAFTEEELVWLANQRLPEHERITYRTFQRYKAEVFETQDIRHKTQDLQQEGVMVSPPSPGSFSDLAKEPVLSDSRRKGIGVVNTCEEVNHLNAESAQLALLMHDTLKGALMQQKLALVRGVMEGQPNWRRYTWMLERKFPDFRLKVAAQSTVHGRQSTVDVPELTDKQSSTNNQSTLAKGETCSPPITKPKTELELIAEKWNRLSKVGPWEQGPDFYVFHLTPESLRELEEEMAEDVAKGYVNPCGHLGYRPATCPPDVDYNDYENGWYTFYTMGTKKGLRLPIRLWASKQIRREPKDPMKELLWAEQEWERQHPGEPYTGETVPIDAWHEYPWPEKLPRLDPEERERPYDPDRSVAHIRGKILGFSNGG